MKKFTYSNPKLALEVLTDLHERLVSSGKKRKKKKKVTRMSN